MLPLRDATPPRRTPVITLAIVAACFAVFAYELWVLVQGGLDALLLALPVRGDDVDELELFREPFVVALPRDHALCSRSELDEDDLPIRGVDEGAAFE